MSVEFLERVVGELERAGIPYMVTGSFASAAHGRIRATEDIDIVIAPTREQLLAFISAFPADRFYADHHDALESFAHHSQFNVIDFATTWKVDLIFRKDREFSREEFKRRQPHVVAGVPVYVATPEDLVIAKLEWAKLGQSERQIEDVAGIIERQGPKLDRAYIERWVNELSLQSEWQRARSPG